MPVDMIRESSLIPLDNGRFAVKILERGEWDGMTIMSQQPDGSIGIRQQIGPWESGIRINNVLVFDDIAYPNPYGYNIAVGI